MRTLARMHLNTIVLAQLARTESLLARRTSAAPQPSPIYDRLHIYGDRYQFSTERLTRDLARALDLRLLHLPHTSDTLLQIRQSPTENVDIVPVNENDPTDDRVQAVFHVSVARRAPKLTAYVASKAKHAARWRAMRTAGAPIVSTWIDEDGPGESHMPSLWERALSECSSAYGGIVYVEPGETQKGALVEMGALLAYGAPIVWVGPRDYLSGLRHPNVRFADSPEEAFEVLQVCLCLEDERDRPGHSYDFTFDGDELRMKLDTTGIRAAFGPKPFYSADFHHTALRLDTTLDIGNDTTKTSFEVIHSGFVLDRKVWVDIDHNHALPFAMPETVGRDLQTFVLRSCKAEIHNILSAPRTKPLTASTP